MIEKDLKHHALTIRFSAFEWALLEQLGKHQQLSTGAVVRASVIGYAREVLREEDWRKVCRSSGGIEWRDWQPPWRLDADPRVASIDARVRALEEIVRELQAKNGEANEGT